MYQPFKFEKILSIKQSEKQQKRLEYEETMKIFEEVAYELYYCLKEKEELESRHELELQKGLSIPQILQHMQYIEDLEEKIEKKQVHVFRAREKMQNKKQAFINQNIEVQKYETMKEKAVQRFVVQQQILENQLMDEISIQQYNNREK